MNPFDALGYYQNEDGIWLPITVRKDEKPATMWNPPRTAQMPSWIGSWFEVMWRDVYTGHQKAPALPTPAAFVEACLEVVNREEP